MQYSPTVEFTAFIKDYLELDVCDTENMTEDEIIKRFYEVDDFKTPADMGEALQSLACCIIPKKIYGDNPYDFEHVCYEFFINPYDAIQLMPPLFVMLDVITENDKSRWCYCASGEAIAILIEMYLDDLPAVE